MMWKHIMMSKIEKEVVQLVERFHLTSWNNIIVIFVCVPKYPKFGPAKANVQDCCCHTCTLRAALSLLPERSHLLPQRVRQIGAKILFSSDTANFNPALREWNLARPLDSLL
jgi:hypothetical protein